MEFPSFEEILQGLSAEPVDKCNIQPVGYELEISLNRVFWCKSISRSQTLEKREVGGRHFVNCTALGYCPGGLWGWGSTRGLT